MEAAQQYRYYTDIHNNDVNFYLFHQTEMLGNEIHAIVAFGKEDMLRRLFESEYIMTDGKFVRK